MGSEAGKVKNGTIILPKRLQKTWEKRKVFMFPFEDILIIKKIRKPLPKLSDLASRISSPKMSQKEIEKEIGN